MIQFISENASSKLICVVLSHTDLERDIVVTVSTEEGTASGNVYTLLYIATFAYYYRVLFLFRNSGLCPNRCSRFSIHGRH